MRPYWTMVDTILGGAGVMRAAGETYLPRFQEERATTDTSGRQYDPYALRLSKAPLTNLYEDILKNLASKPFAKELTMKDETPSQYMKLAENIDAHGRNLHVWASEVFRAGINHGITWILVDFTRALPRADGRPLTRADEQAQGLRVYWQHVQAPRMIAVYTDFEGGREIITHARISEPSITLDGYLEETVQRIRVLDRAPIAWDAAGKPIAWGPPTFTVWELVTGVASGQTASGTSWQIVDRGAYSGINVIPLIPFMTGDRIQGTYQIVPPLRGVAYMQIDEYQQESNLQNIIELTCFPMLSGSGVQAPADGEIKLAISPRTILLAPPPASGGTPGGFQWIEPGAQSVRAVMDKLEKTRTEMRDLGMQPLTQGNLTVITTAQVAVKANSTVQAWAIRFKDALEQAWKLTAQWMGDSAFEPEVVIYKDFGPMGLDDGKGFEAVMKMRANNDVSRDAVVNAAVRYGYLPDDFDVEDDAEKLATEQEGLQPEQTIDPRTGQPIEMTRPVGNGLQSPQLQ
jgi:hypothetical protein